MTPLIDEASESPGSPRARGFEGAQGFADAAEPLQGDGAALSGVDMARIEEDEEALEPGERQGRNCRC